MDFSVPLLDVRFGGQGVSSLTPQHPKHSAPYAVGNSKLQTHWDQMMLKGVHLGFMHFQKGFPDGAPRQD